MNESAVNTWRGLMRASFSTAIAARARVLLALLVLTGLDPAAATAPYSPSFGRQQVALVDRQAAPAALADAQATPTALADRQATPVALSTRYDVKRGAKRVTRTLQAVNVGVFLLLARRQPLFNLLAKNDALIRRGQLHRLCTGCLLHASVSHLFVNSYSLGNLGEVVEPWFGPGRTLAVYAVSGVAGNLLSLYARGAPVAVGASGAIFGLLGAWCVFLQRNADFFEECGVRVSDSLGAVLKTAAFNAAFGALPGSRIDQLGHLGGFLGGAACSFAFGPRLRRSRFIGGAVDEPLLRLPSPAVA